MITRAANVKLTKYLTMFCCKPRSPMLLCQSGGSDFTCAGTALTFAKSGRRALEQHMIGVARVGCNLQLLLSVLFNYEILLAISLSIYFVVGCLANPTKCTEAYLHQQYPEAIIFQ